MNGKPLTELFEQEKKSAAERMGTPTAAPVPQLPLLMGEVQLHAIEHLNIGLTPTGQKVLQFVQGPLTVTVLIPNDETKTAIVKGLTGVELAR